MTPHEEPRTIEGTTRRGALRSGLLAGFGLAAFGATSAALTGTARAYSPQYYWAWCINCAGMWYTLNGGGVCPNGISPHNKDGSYIYAIEYNQGQVSNPQGNWSWCSLCQGLFYWPNQAHSFCPGNFNVQGTGLLPHQGIGQDGSYNYYLPYNRSIVSDPQSFWRWCGKCQGLYYQGGSGTSKGSCPAFYPDYSRGHEMGGGSYNYAIVWQGSYPG